MLIRDYHIVFFSLHRNNSIKKSKTSRKPHAETTKDPRFNVSP
jgi:hypothetical protein